MAGTVPVKTYRDVVLEYTSHPESKAAGPDGRPAGPKTIGELKRLRVRLTRAGIRHISKESNDLDVAEVLGIADETIQVYEPSVEALLAQVAEFSAADVSTASGLTRQHVYNLTSGRSKLPRASTIRALRCARDALNTRVGHAPDLN
jgi:hypothetical protein